jgi:hypothetical protein
MRSGFCVNQEIVLASMKSDLDRDRLSYFCENLDLPSIAKATYSKYQKQIISRNEEVPDRLFLDSCTRGS